MGGPEFQKRNTKRMFALFYSLINLIIQPGTVYTSVARGQARLYKNEKTKASFEMQKSFLNPVFFSCKLELLCELFFSRFM